MVILFQRCHSPNNNTILFLIFLWLYSLRVLNKNFPSLSPLSLPSNFTLSITPSIITLPQRRHSTIPITHPVSHTSANIFLSSSKQEFPINITFFPSLHHYSEPQRFQANPLTTSSLTNHIIYIFFTPQRLYFFRVVNKNFPSLSTFPFPSIAHRLHHNPSLTLSLPNPIIYPFLPLRRLSIHVLTWKPVHFPSRASRLHFISSAGR